MNNPLREGSQNGQYAAVIPENRRYEYMYDENERNERHDQDVDYTEGAYSDSAYEEKNNDTAKKKKLPIMAVIMIPLPGQSRWRTGGSSRSRSERECREAAGTQLYSGRTGGRDMALRILVRKLRHL